MGNSDELYSWLLKYDSQSLKNEDDVETKFVLPFFRLLGYPDECRRGKYPINLAKKARRAGRKNEVDQVYFSEIRHEFQGEASSLVLIEAKSPGARELDEALREAEFYAFYVKPILLVVTNGFDLMVVYFLPHSRNEFIFAGTINDLRQREEVNRLYNKIWFTAVDHQKRKVSDFPAYEQQIDLFKTLLTYPALQEIVSRGDFKEETTRNGQQFRVVRRKVAIDCQLPKTGLDQGTCSIEFSNPLRSGLTIALTHEQIVASLLTGLHSEPHWNARRFLKARKDGLFLMTLGDVIATITKPEAIDLCECVDVIFQEYRQIIVELEDTLKSWNYDVISSEWDYRFGFHLLTVPRWLWFQMLKFSQLFDYESGDSKWHIFSSRDSFICVETNRIINAELFPQPQFYGTPTDDVQIVFIPYLWDVSRRRGDWKKYVGMSGVWTAKYTKLWLMKDFIPEVIRFFGFKRDLVEQIKGLWKIGNIYSGLGRNLFVQWLIQDPNPNPLIPIEHITHLSQLEWYIRDIQRETNYWSSLNVPAELIRDYYAAFLQVAQHVIPAPEEVRYMTSKLYSLEKERLEIAGIKNDPPVKNDYKAVLRTLKKEVDRIQQIEFEDAHTLDMLCRIFLTVIDANPPQIQAELNTAKNAILPIWNYARFENRHVEKAVAAQRNR